MLPPFIPAASTASTKPADQSGIHKPEAAAPAPGTSFHELLARKTNAPPKQSQAQVHSQAQFHSKAHASNLHNARANDHAEARTNSRTEPKPRETSAEGPSDTATAARDASEKPVDHSVNRRLAKPAAKTPSPAADAKTAATQATGRENTSSAREEGVTAPADAPLADAPVDASATDAPKTEAAVLPLLAALSEPPLPLATVAPLTLGLPSAGVPAPALTPESSDTTAAAAEVELAEGNLQGASAATGTPNGYATNKPRTSQNAASKSPDPFPVNLPATPETNTATSATAASPATPNSSSPAPAIAESAAGDTTATTAAQTDPRQGANAYGLAAQIADTTKAGNPAAQDLAAGKIKNSNQDTDSKEDKKLSMSDGIRRAYELPSMSTTTPVFQAPTASVQTLGPVNANSPVAPTVASTAVRMVEKVSEVAEHLASHPAEQVTVRIDLDATHRVDVHVSMRGGQVHADFRSDSADMRAALASAWNEFSQGREGTDRRWAEPAFAPMAAPAASSNFTSNQQSSEGASSFGPGQDSANRQAAEREAQAQRMGTPTRVAASSTAPAPAAADVKTPIIRPENSQHLSVLA